MSGSSITLSHCFSQSWPTHSTLSLTLYFTSSVNVSDSVSEICIPLRWRLLNTEINKSRDLMTSSNYIFCFHCFYKETSSGLNYIWWGYISLEGIRFFSFLFFLVFASLMSPRQEDRSHSFDCACSNKEETGRACPMLISLAQTLVVNRKC